MTWRARKVIALETIIRWSCGALDGHRPQFARASRDLAFSKGVVVVDGRRLSCRCGLRVERIGEVELLSWEK